MLAVFGVQSKINLAVGFVVHQKLEHRFVFLSTNLFSQMADSCYLVAAILNNLKRHFLQPGCLKLVRVLSWVENWRGRWLDIQGLPLDRGRGRHTLGLTSI